MFKFLKDKLKKAVQSFSKKAEEEVVEEKVDDAKIIEQAKIAEEKLATKRKKATVIEDMPEAKAHRAKQEKIPQKPQAKSQEKPVSNPELKPVPVLKPEQKSKPEPEQKPKSKLEQKPAPKKSVAEIKKPVVEKVEPENKKEDSDKKRELEKKVIPERKEIAQKVEEPLVEEKPAPEVVLDKPKKFLGIFKRKEKPVPVVEKGLDVEEPEPEPIPEPEPEEELESKTDHEEPEDEFDEEEKFEEDSDEQDDLEKEEISEDEEPFEDEEPLDDEEPVEKSKRGVENEPESEPAPEEEPEDVDEKKGFFGKLKETFTKKKLSQEKFDELFWELELTMLENNVAVEVIEKIKHDLEEELTTGKVTRRGIDQMIMDSLRESIESLFVDPFDLVKKIKQEKKRPYVIAFIGVNGSGKTTTLAKIANLLQEEDMRVVMAASDTFRAAAIDQLQEHADKLGIKLISQGYGADPAAVAFDAIEHAKAKFVDVVMIDTAGRLHSNTNLMAELEKVIRVAKPDLKIFIGESITGNDCVEQAKEFDKLVGIDAIILSKADVDEKGGAAISVSYVTGKPILYLGTGQAYGDLTPFDKEKIIQSLGL